MNPERPLDRVTSIKVKLGLLVGLSILVATIVIAIGRAAGVPLWLSLPVTLAAALGVTQWLARGMTAPLREMTHAASRLAAGDHSVQVTTTANDEVGELARSFTSMATQLAAVDRQRRELVATVSHELRTPLAAQQALLENLADGIVPTDEATLRSALAQSERLGTLVRDLLDLSRIDGGQTPLQTTNIAVSAMLEAAVAEGRLQGRDVRFNVAVDPIDLTVVGDPGRLAQVVANLLDNAIRHSPAGGEVPVRAGREGATEWYLEVSDDGPGLPADATDRLFDRFGTGTDAGGGTGLGLAIAAWVCELHGGRIAAVSGGPGATVRAVLPIRPTSNIQGETMTTPVAPAYPIDPPAPPRSGQIWPEHGLAPQPRLIWASLGVGVAAAVLLPYRNLGLATLVVLLLAGGVLWLTSARRREPWLLGSVAVCLVLGLLLVLRADPAVAFLAVMSGAIVTAVALTDARRLLGMVASVVAWVLSGLRGLPLLGRSLQAMSNSRVLWPVLRTAAISLVAIVLFGGLFASADAVLGSWASKVIPDLGWDSIIFRTFVLVMFAGVTLAGSYLALNPPAVDRLGLTTRPLARAWEWQLPLGTVIAMYVAFLVAQSAALFGGHDYIRRTTGLTYADYVHQGFGQLIVVTGLTLAVVALVRRRAATQTSRDRWSLKVMLGLLCVLTLAVVASALLRLSLYEDAYGWTRLRLFVTGFEIWLGLLAVCVLASVITEKTDWLARAALVSGALFTIGYGAMNPAGFVAAHNLDRYAATGKLDAAYLAGLGDDAVPTIASANLPADLKACLVTIATSSSKDDPLAWNFGRSRARAELAKVSSVPPRATCWTKFDTYPSG